VLTAALSEAAAPPAIHIDGSKARQLLSILLSADTKAFDRVETSNGIVVRDLTVLAQATHKYDETDSRYRIEIYSARGKVDGSQEEVSIAEATSLWNFLVGLGIGRNASLQGADLQIETIDCRVDPNVAFAKASRFQCDIQRLN
jgi:hypothetical protein